VDPILIAAVNTILHYEAQARERGLELRPPTGAESLLQLVRYLAQLEGQLLALRQPPAVQEPAEVTRADEPDGE